MIPARAVWGLWVAAARPAHRAYARALGDPDRAQRELLRRILRGNEAARTGRRLGFASIDSPEAFARRVPTTGYDELEPTIEALASGATEVLTTEPVERLVPSGGSSGATKLVPFTRSLGRDFARAISAWIVDLVDRRPEIRRGPSYWSVSPAMDPLARESAIPVGFEDDAAYLGRRLSPLVSRALVAPSAMARARPLDSFRYATLRSLLAARDLTLISVWHPSFLTLLLEPRRHWWERLIEDVGRGTLRPPIPLAPAVQRALEATLRPDPDRALELESLGPRAHLSAIWPRLALVSAWGDAAAAGPCADLVEVAAGIEVQPKGLLATEGVVSIPFQGRHPLAVRSTYVELCDDRGVPHRPSEVRTGGEYEVVITTSGGLYRYRLGDVVRVDGWVGSTPSVRLVGRADRVVDRCGEKLSERFVARALARAYDDEPLPAFAMLAPEGARYCLFVDRPPRSPGQLRARLTAALRESPGFAYAQDLGQLGPLAIVLTSSEADRRYLERRHETGQGLGSIKPTHLAAEDGWLERLGGRIVPTTVPPDPSRDQGDEPR